MMNESLLTRVGASTTRGHRFKMRREIFNRIIGVNFFHSVDGGYERAARRDSRGRYNNII